MIKVIPIILCIMSSASMASEKYLCIPSKSVGYSYNKATDEWTMTKFKPESKYIVYNDPSDINRWLVKDFDNNRLATCRNGFSKIGKLYCDGRSEFRMNKFNGRFVYSYMHGYWTDGINEIIRETEAIEKNPFYDIESVEGSDNPVMEIGKCTTI